MQGSPARSLKLWIARATAGCLTPPASTCDCKFYPYLLLLQQHSSVLCRARHACDIRRPRHPGAHKFRRKIWLFAHLYLRLDLLLRDGLDRLAHTLAREAVGDGEDRGRDRGAIEAVTVAAPAEGRLDALSRFPGTYFVVVRLGSFL